MFVMNNDFFDGFSVLFGDKWSILNGKPYPLGYFATAYLDLGEDVLTELSDSIETLELEFKTYLSSRSPTSADLGQQALNNTWKLMMQLPVYFELGSVNNAEHLFKYFREHPFEVDDMVTQGTERNLMMQAWLERLHNLVDRIKLFISQTTTLLDDYYAEPPERNADVYAKIFGRYNWDIHNYIDVMDQEMTIDGLSDEEQLERRQEIFEEIERRNIPGSIPVEISYTSVAHPTKEDERVLVEQIKFVALENFLYLDLLKGIAAGHIPRRCDHCKRFFLLDSGYDIRYCTNIAPNEDSKTCRQVGAHEKEKILNGTVQVRVEYRRVYERLKARKRYGSITTDEWNVAVAKAQSIKAQAENGELSEPEWKAEFAKI